MLLIFCRKPLLNDFLFFTSQQDTIKTTYLSNPKQSIPRTLGHLATLYATPHLFKSQYTLSERRQISTSQAHLQLIQPPHLIANMSAIVEKVTDAVNDVTAKLGNTTISESKPAEDKAAKDAHNEAVLASAAEGRRLYIGNLAYATTEGELKAFFDGYLM